MRGTVWLLAVHKHGIGITPAHAGNRTAKDFDESVSKDHPRTCGEQEHFLGRNLGRIGSPPHMRGTEQNSQTHCIKQGITPAHAGNSMFLPDPLLIRQDHPRTCGEQSSISFW